MSLALREYFWDAWPAAPPAEAGVIRLEELAPRFRSWEMDQRVRARALKDRYLLDERER